ncbi:MAG: hypothetical protein LBC60_00025, partial [Spirochaetaceae bacterium]|nr:hypothetical protein [Spirochaetaceae bacterium]
MKIKFFLPLIIFQFFFISCAATINGSLAVNGSGDFTLRASLESRMSALIRSFSAISLGPEAARNRPVIDGPAIARSMAAAPGIAEVSFTNTGPAAIEGPIKISRIDEFLALPGNRGENRFIVYEQTPSGGRLALSLDRDSGPKILALISREVADYLAGLMAPVSTGEFLSKGEYLGLVTSIYGKAVADEIAAAKIRAFIDFPGPVNMVRGGTYRGIEAIFEVPLLDLL